jgi:hypothetical protein
MSPGSQALPLASNALRRLAHRAAPLGFAMLAVAAFAPGVASAASDPPPGRGYELVSPPSETTGGMAGLSTDLYPLPARSSGDGDALIYGSGSSVGDNWSGPANPMVFGWRTESGWRARTATRSTDHGDTALELIAHEARSGWLTPEGREFVFGTGKPLGGTTAGVVPGLYRTTSDPTVPAWLSQPQGDLPLASGTDFINVSAGGEDLRTVVFQSTARLTEDAPPAPALKVYANRDGALELVSVLPDGSVPTANVSLANGFANTAASAPARILRNQLAGGGRFVLFLAGGFRSGSAIVRQPLYVRDLERDVTHQLAGGGGGGAPDVATHLGSGWGPFNPFAFTLDVQTMPYGTVFAARDGARAFFNTQQPDGVVRTLYEADLETGEVTARPELSGPPLALSRDGARMLFLDPPSGGGQVGDWTLRSWDASDPDSSVALGTIPVPSTNPAYGFAQGYEPSPDGRTWTFVAMGSLDPERPNASPGIRQLYLWNVGDAAPTCVSCQPTDAVARYAGPNVSVQEGISSEGMMTPTTAMSPSTNASKMAIAQPGHSVSDDGRWLLFDSPDRLVAQDRNDVRDVYIWDRDGGPGGEVSLVTGGTGSTPSYALDLDPTGRNAFFSTRDKLVEGDVNGAFDIYVARIGGGFAKSPESSCGGDGCRPALGAPVAPPVAGSVTFVGRGDVSAPSRVAVRVSGLRAVTGRVARLKVRVSGAGRLAVSGRSVRNVRRSPGRAGTYRLRVALKPRARRVLAKRERLRVAVRVTYRSESGRRVSRTVRIAFKQPVRAGRKGGR